MAKKNEATNEATAAEEAPVKEPKVEREKRNNVTKPAAGTVTGRVWEVADEVSRAQGRPALRGEVMAILDAEGVSKGTIATQYGKWCTYYGVDKATRAAVREANKPATNDAEGQGDADPDDAGDEGDADEGDAEE